MIPEFIDMTTASGGFTVRMVDDYNDFEASMSNYAMVFSGSLIAKFILLITDLR